MPHGRWSQRRDVGLEGVGDMPPVNQVTPGFREMFDARLQKSGDEVLMVELFAESWPKGTMSLHRVSDESVGEWVFSHNSTLLSPLAAHKSHREVFAGGGRSRWSFSAFDVAA